MEASGFLYTARTVKDLRDITIAGLGPGVCPRTSVYDWDPGEDSTALCTLLEEKASEVARVFTEDSGSTSLQTQKVPDTLIRHFTSWVIAHSTPSNTSAPGTPQHRLAPEVGLSAEQGGVRERTVWFGRNRDLFGILSLPETSDPGDDRPAIVLVNGGNNHRVGINRNYVEWARSWASRGWTVLRMDIRGLGDSPPAKQSDLNRLYLNRTVEDLRAACDWLQNERGCREFTIAGLCAGAYQALHLARADARVRGLILLELLRIYPWEPLRITGNAFLYRFNRRWARIHPMWLVDRGRIGRWLQDICERGTRCLVVYREDEGMLERFRAEISARSDALEQSGNLVIRELGPSNHIISPLWAQEELENLLTAYLEDSRSAG